MTNEAIAEKISERMYQIVNLPAALAEIESLRLRGERLQQQVGLVVGQIEALNSDKLSLEASVTHNTELLFSATQRVDDLLAALYRPVAAPAETVEKVAKLARGKKVAPPTSETVTKEKHPCHLCEDVFYHKVDLVKHLRISHGLFMEESVKLQPTRSVCADCLASDCDPFDVCTGVGVTSCDGHRTDPNEDQVKWRDSTCEEWRECPFTAKCFGPANEEDPTCFKEDEIRKRGEASLSNEFPACDACGKPITEGQKDVGHECNLHEGCVSAPADAAGVIVPGPSQPCWNASCAWADLAKPDHCDADEQFRANRPVAECKCFVNGIGPTNGQNAAACFNTDCPSNDPTLPTGCEEWEEVWECPEVVTAGWGAAAEEEAQSVDTYRDQRDAIIKAAKAAGDDINDHGVYLNPEIITIPLPKKSRYVAEIKLATNADGGFLYGYNFQRKDEGTSGPASVSSKVYLSRKHAIAAAIQFLKTCWPETLTEKKLKPVRDAVEDFENAIFAPAPKQETPNEAATQEAGPESVETEQGGAGDAVLAVEQVTFQPLDGPFNNCELCHGFGVIDGELYGEFKLVPCTCEAGGKVRYAQAEADTARILPAGSEVEMKKCCEDCSIEDPDCANCNLIEQGGAEPVAEPVKCFNRKCTSFNSSKRGNCYSIADMAEQGDVRCVTGCNDYMPENMVNAVPAELERCASGPCTATGKRPKDTCLRVQGKRCNNFVPVEKCQHNKFKQTTQPDGSITCDLCGLGLQAAPVKSELTPLQQRCVHPKVFREETEAGVTCKACRLVLSGGGGTQAGLFAV